MCTLYIHMYEHCPLLTTSQCSNFKRRVNQLLCGPIMNMRLLCLVRAIFKNCLEIKNMLIIKLIFVNVV